MFADEWIAGALDAIGLGVLYRQWNRCFDIGLVRVPAVVGTESSLPGNVVLLRLAGWGGADGHTAVEGSFGVIKAPPAKQKVVPMPGASGKMTTLTALNCSTAGPVE